MALYVPPFARTNGARPITPESSPSSSSRAASPSSHASAWQNSCRRWSSGSGDLPAPTSTTWRRGSGALPAPTTSPSSSSATSSPPLRHRALTGDWRRGAASKPFNPDYVVGRVVLLPSDEQVPATSIARRDVQGAPWNHPAVITKVWEANGTKLVRIRTCTSFRGNGIAHKQHHHHRYFVEASRGQLTDESDEFVKQTWVNCSPDSGLTIEAQHLCIYTGKGKGGVQFDLDALLEFNRNERFPRRDSFF
ncbi:hypothetical protein SVAN01_00083 [Stagonosporopsis vannaccii]|nr:hypothetical protein SVAN01_00083 [Stagonosporopsis vannaccii]